jgi:hypothetical protein
MEQRRLRLGDILDDYCPRERRVTNHAVVAMIEEDVKQTRCTTCDAEHAYKGGKVPRSRRKSGPGALYREVLAGMTDGEPPRVVAAPGPPAAEAPSATEELAPDATETERETPEPEPDSVRAADAEDGPVHRPLIRATLPRPEGQKEARPLPEFTVRHSGARANGREGGNRARGPGGNGFRAQGGHRFSGPRGNRGQGPRGVGGGFRPSQPRHGGRKRSR